MMPDLPNVDFERDVEQFIEFFENPAFRADGMFTNINYLVTRGGARVCVTIEFSSKRGPNNVFGLYWRTFFELVRKRK